MESSSIPSLAVQTESLTVPNWLELPRDATVNILQKLNTVDIITRACHVCPLWWNICKDPSMWRTIRMNMDLTYNRACWKKICHTAVGRSRGQLEDVNIKYFATDDLLQYIVDCSKQLRRLRLIDCRSLTYEGFSEALNKLPLLEALDIYHCTLSEDLLEVVGRHCPLLNSLRYRNSIDDEEGYIDISNEHELALLEETFWRVGFYNILNTGNFVTNEGVSAILDGCPLLETLDLRGCRSWVLSDSLEKRCHQQIQDFRSPIYYVYFSFNGQLILGPAK
ncbi:putative F-box/LRR-repeat protein 23 [Vicia villosa]|uniref:putative F-box/LRR-repeat protein 23 n=1 Tax=Vicia villosa TaxID=3911 RepID=UPI00273C2348|nr:putative F-box/LRR-repeat protein 23 [Vicia villosa]